MLHYFLQFCVNMVFRHDWGPPSFSFIYLDLITLVGLKTLQGALLLHYKELLISR
jgi:hypothetical protein